MTFSVNTKLVDFPDGKVIGARWKVIKKLGSGAYGAVYQVQSLENAKIIGALKVESNDAEESILKLEVEVLKQLQCRPHTIHLIHSGKRDIYSYMVMTLCGPDLSKIQQCNDIKTFSENTTLRVAILSLYAIKQLHEIGYVHRDIKPSNLAIGASKQDRHVLYLIDFGMVRRYAVRTNKSWQIRLPRKRVVYFRNLSLRGTLLIRTFIELPNPPNETVECKPLKGRVDDLWSLMYMLIDLRTNYLPWGHSSREDRILCIKENTSDEQLLAESKMEFYHQVFVHLRQLKYPDRPDYGAIYEAMIRAMCDKNYLFNEPYDWETPTDVETQWDSSASFPSRSRRASPREVAEGIETACREAFSEQPNDVPDISKIQYRKTT